MKLLCLVKIELITNLHAILTAGQVCKWSEMLEAGGLLLLLELI